MRSKPKISSDTFPGKLGTNLDREIAKLEEQIQKTRKEVNRLRRARASFTKPETAILAIDISLLGLSSRTLSRLRGLGVTTIRQVVDMPERELGIIRTYNTTDYFDIRHRLEECGITLCHS